MTTIKIIENGPAIINDDQDTVVVGNEKGFKEFTDGKAVAICRCGKSTNQPYCDGTHKKKEVE